MVRQCTSGIQHRCRTSICSGFVTLFAGAKEGVAFLGDSRRLLSVICETAASPTEDLAADQGVCFFLELSLVVGEASM